MKKFLAVYLGTVNGEAMARYRELDEETRKTTEQAGMEAWMKWMQDNQAAVIDQGGPLGKTKRVSGTGIEDVSNALGAFTVVRAESHEAAAKLFEGHPHFTIFPGDGVEIMECLPMPQ